MAMQTCHSTAAAACNSTTDGGRLGGKPNHGPPPNHGTSQCMPIFWLACQWAYQSHTRTHGTLLLLTYLYKLVQNTCTTKHLLIQHMCSQGVQTTRLALHTSHTVWAQLPEPAQSQSEEALTTLTCEMQGNSIPAALWCHTVAVPAILRIYSAHNPTLSSAH